MDKQELLEALDYCMMLDGDISIEQFNRLVRNLGGDREFYHGDHKDSSYIYLVALIGKRLLEVK